jgi:hypothetical protein
MSLTPVASKNATAATTVKSGPGALCSVVLTSGADAASVTVYDNTAASGTILCKLAVAAGATTAVFAPAQPLAAGKGIHFAITGTTPSVTVSYL